MAAVSSGYDLSVATFSPDGRVFQVEYAKKALDNSGACMGAVFQDGIVLAVNKQLPSKLMVPESASRVFLIDKHIICCAAGFLADARQLVNRCRQECVEYRRVFQLPIPGHVLAERIGLYVHAHTAVWSVRPFGCGLLIGVVEPNDIGTFEASRAAPVTAGDVSMKVAGEFEPHHLGDSKLSLYSVDPSGATFKYLGCALAKGSAMARAEIEKLNLSATTCEDGMSTFLKAIKEIYAENQEKSSKVEMIWLKRPAVGGEFEASVVPTELVDRLEAAVDEEIRRQENE